MGDLTRPFSPVTDWGDAVWPPAGCAFLPPGSIRVEPAYRYVNLSRLPAAEKRAAWRHIQATDAALAAVLSCDHVRSLVTAFDAQLLVPREAAGLGEGTVEEAIPRSITAG